MSKALVAYYSLTGNTKQVAEAIWKSLEGEKSLKSLKDITTEELQEFTLLFVGFPVHSHSVPYAVEEFLKKIPKGTKTALFSSHGALKGSRLAREALEYAHVLAAGTKVLGTFSCRGRVSPQALEILMKSPEHQLWTEMAASANTHPDESDLEDARTFAHQIQTLSHHS
jgi:flavodoxin